MAQKLQHPFDSDYIRQARAGNLQDFDCWPYQIHEERVHKIRWMKAMILETRKEEEEIRSRMHPDVRRVIEGKSLFCLFEMMLKEIDYAGRNLVRDMLIGMALTGNPDVSGVFAPTSNRHRLK